MLSVLVLVIKGLSFLWKILDDSNLYDVAFERIKINMKALCLTSVDEKGGLVHVNVGPPEGALKMPAKTFSGIILKKGYIAYVIGIEGAELILDIEPLPQNEDLSKPLDQSTWIESFCYLVR